MVHYIQSKNEAKNKPSSAIKKEEKYKIYGLY